MIKLYLKPNRDRSVRRFHPWIFSGALARLDGAKEPGMAEIIAANGEFLGRGFYNPHSQIVCRILTWRDEAIDAGFFRRKIENAYITRRRLFATNGQNTNAFRLVNAEGDGLPGLIVDKYADYLVVQISTLGMSHFRNEIVAALQELIQPEGIFERSTGAALHEEGLPAVTQVLAGAAMPRFIHIRENDLHFAVDVHEGQKTGFFLDQRENRAWVARLCQKRNVLNGFGYTGAFSVYAKHAGAQRVVTVDSSSAAIELAKQNFALNNLEAVPEDFVIADIFHYLRATTQKFDFIILDPPAFAHRQKDIENAARAYKDVNLQAMKIIEPGGLLLTCSCSQPVSPDLFQKILFGAAADAKRAVRILGQSGHAPDHPISVYHPEGRYLQAMLLHVN
ncbi:MAG: class I SAM-dependent rRNA methyltransferase [candidate division KSB1 bacterium]|nr:class I SAM-dependent rRNA methyltransferase [candidate division KSB1 bacterium]MDZ7369168.1 class I SAM-dependent rRNA methyltransferase [candidate division KSB1 bacterium]MDZ7407138.1 class I SAM-dependent rRNA methyltransferase [candidate division KSB1 bacterium]